jgi:hypothetical protein
MPVRILGTALERDGSATVLLDNRLASFTSDLDADTRHPVGGLLEKVLPTHHIVRFLFTPVPVY